MKRISKGIACALVLGVATLGLTGCGTKATTDNTNTNGAAPQQTQQPQQNDQPDTAQQPQEEIKKPVETADGAGDAVLTEQLATYIAHVESLESADSVKITKLEIVEETADSKVAKATIDVKLNGNMKSTFKQGTNERYVQFNNVQDIWEVGKLSEAPLKLAK